MCHSSGHASVADLLEERLKRATILGLDGGETGEIAATLSSDGRIVGLLTKRGRTSVLQKVGQVVRQTPNEDGQGASQPIPHRSHGCAGCVGGLNDARV